MRKKRSFLFLFCRTKVITWGAQNSQKKKDANALENTLHLELQITCNKIAFIFLIDLLVEEARTVSHMVT